MTQTDQLIRRLAERDAPVSPLPPPLRRAVVWIALAIPYVALVVSTAGLRPDLGMKLAETRFIVEAGATLATAVVAAFAAFSAVVPGRSRAYLWAPLVPLALWLGSLGQGCIETVRTAGLSALNLGTDWSCLPNIILVGTVPAILMAVMLRRGAPLYPHLAVALGGLAAAALGNFGLRLFHTTDASLMVLVWQFGTVALLTAIACCAGPLVHNWDQMRQRI